MSQIILPVDYTVNADEQVSFSGTGVGKCSNREDPITLEELEKNPNKLGFVFSKSDSRGNNNLFDCYQEPEENSVSNAETLINRRENPATREPFENIEEALDRLRPFSETVTLVVDAGSEVSFKINPEFRFLDSNEQSGFYSALFEATEVRTSAGVTKIPIQQFFIGTTLKRAVLNEGLKIISEAAFLGTSLQTIDLPQSVERIYQSAFQACTALTNLILPPNLELLASGAFRKCTALRSVVFSGNIDFIGYGAFDSCTALESVEFQGSVGEIEEVAFGDCPNLNRVVVDDRATIHERAFDDDVEIVKVAVRAVDDDGPPRQRMAIGALLNWMNPNAHMKEK